jgi:hypothetical protein
VELTMTLRRIRNLIPINDISQRTRLLYSSIYAEIIILPAQFVNYCGMTCTIGPFDEFESVHEKNDTSRSRWLHQRKAKERKLGLIQHNTRKHKRMYKVVNRLTNYQTADL